MKFISTLLLIGIFSSATLSQTPFGQADKEFDALAYQDAAHLFEKLMKETALSGMEKLSAQAKLAYSYRQIKDSENAERVFREMISDYGKDLPESYTSCYLYFAQALASNGKYQEAQDTYTKYGVLKNGEKQGPVFSKLNSNVALLTKNVGSYKVDYLTINSAEADFSPTRYKDGLVFVSGRNEAISVKRVFKWDQSAFLDLYYLPDLNRLKGKGHLLAGRIECHKPDVKQKTAEESIGDGFVYCSYPKRLPTSWFFCG